MIEDFNQNVRVATLRQSILRTAGEGNLCISGGAKGADLLWGKAAIDAGMQSVHWSFAGHRTSAIENVHGRVYRLSDVKLEVAAPILEVVARRLGRRLSSDPHVRPLLLRDLFQTIWSDSVYAVSSFDAKRGVNGGTAWAVEVLRMRGTGSAYVFCQQSQGWHVSVDGNAWKGIAEDDIPVPGGIWAGIGTRNLKPEGEAAIERMAVRMRSVPAQVPGLV